jgi:hypothetical protein
MRSAASRSLSAAYLDIGSIRSFRIADLVNGGFIPRDFQLAALTDDLELWFDQATPAASRAFVTEDWLRRFQAIAGKKLKPIWGSPTDIDRNGRIRLMFSPTVNDSGLAVGFFNPSDLYPRVDAPGKDSNPVSNEGEYLYLAVPSGASPFFSLPSLAATLAHEGFHLIHYGTRVLTPWLNTGRIVPEENVAISEGLAHLSEALCGYGVSGGDVAYIASFLKAPARSSFTGPDMDGSTDTVAKRGAWLLFLGWLVQHEAQDGHFLRDILKPSDSAGWTRLGETYGRSTDQLFLEWAENMETKDVSASPLDADTFEPTILSGWEGSIEWAPGNTVALNGPTRVAFASSTTLPPGSVAFWETADWTDKATMPATTIIGQGYLTLSWLGE